MARIVKIIIDNGVLVDVVNLPDTCVYEVEYRGEK